jgi:hypothetical protein
MKSHRAVLVLLLAVGLVASSCNSRAERTDGTVLLEITSVTGPNSVAVRGASSFLIGTLSLVNIPKDPTSVSSSFQDIELRSYEVTYRRRDTGTRVPPPISAQISGIVAVNGSTSLVSLPFLTSNQLLSPPLSDLSNFGRDSETGTAVIVLDVSVRVFGRTISGDDVASQTATFTVEVTP